MSDARGDLVIRAQAGSHEAFASLIESNWARLVRLARSVVGEADAEDAVQEGLLAAWRHLDRLADPARFGAWAGRIVFRRCLRRSKRHLRLVPLEDAPEHSHDPETAGEVAVWDLLARLAPRQRAVLHLTVVEGMTDSEIGALLGIGAGSVRAHRRRARQAIAALLDGGRR